MDMVIAVGSPAPDFILKDNRGNMVSLSSFKGKKVLLSWHPLAWTRVCGEQMVSLEKHFKTFKELNAEPLGMSIDSHPSKNAWAKQLELPRLKLLSDFWPHGGVAKSYGLFREAEGYSERANVIVDELGIVRWVKLYEIPQLPDIQEVLAEMAKIQAS
jgi:peroxiredoxin